MPYVQRLLAVLLLLCPLPASGQITLDGTFDHGSLQSWSIGLTDGFGSEPQINLVGRDNFYGGGRWRWFYFKATGVQGTQPTFATTDRFAGGASLLDDAPMFFSYDNENWQVFDNNERSDGLYRFSENTPFTEDEVWVAYSVPYSYGRSVEHTQNVLATPWATPTLSGDTNGVIGQSPGGVDDLGRTIEPRDIFGYRITDPSVANEGKTKIVITTGMHAAETAGRWTYQGMVDWLVSDDPGAATLRKLADVYAYPTMNPDGVFAGLSRATVQNPNRDPNGLWNPSLWQPHEDIKVNGEAMLADVLADDNDVLAFIDFHSTWPTPPGDDFGFIEIDQGDNFSPFWVELKRLRPNIGEIDSTSRGWISANFGEFFLGAEVDVTFETHLGLPRTQDYYLGLGADFGRAFLTALVPEPTSMALAVACLGVAAKAMRRR
ncbi:MAG: M14 family zinc carboxypeptidase [Planctomycetota bacterium]